MSFEDKKGEANQELQVDLTAEIKLWQDRLLFADPDELPDLQEQAAAKLNSLCPHLEQWCAFGGTTHYKTLNEDGSVTKHFGPFYGQGQSFGFDVVNPDGGGRPSIHYKFLQGVEGNWVDPMEYLQHTFLAFMEPNGIVLPKTEIDSVFLDVPPDNLAHSLETFIEDMETASQELEMLYQSTDFRRSELKIQQALVDSVTVRYDQRYVAMRGMKLVMQTQQCIRPQVVDGRLRQLPVSIEGRTIRGMFMGFSSLERASLSTKPLRYERDFYKQATGLCMILELAEPVEKTKLLAKDIILVPSANQATNLGIVGDAPSS
jgi:hypothetical protein